MTVQQYIEALDKQYGSEWKADQEKLAHNIKRFAAMQCETQRQLCAVYAEVKQEYEYVDSLAGHAMVSRVNEDSIINAPQPEM